jgi:hypothetical protein
LCRRISFLVRVGLAICLQILHPIKKLKSQALCQSSSEVWVRIINPTKKIRKNNWPIYLLRKISVLWSGNLNIGTTV